MTWLACRQFRAQAAVAAAVTVVVSVVLALTRDHIASVPEDELSTAYESLRLLGTALIGLPAFIGAFWGAPLLARELEAGTHRLAWTQSVTRQRWLALKLAVAGVATILVTAVLGLLFTWWSLPFDRLGNRIGTANFGQRGIAPIGYALFALVLGTLLGAVMRRTLPAMAATLVGFFVARFMFQLAVRPHILDPVSTSGPTAAFGQPAGRTQGAWILSSRTVDASGHEVEGIDNVLAQACDLSRDSTEGAFRSCADQLGIHDVVKMHPADQFWTLQAWETAGFVALAVVLSVAAFWWVRHRTA